ncbi:family 16 glycoside hydrolase [Kitasatospora sp. NPDC085895]|uniref:family 16 glycoside hydrolase n=1 Tax=Kitasatospora sp. NPDC085895 TaxID=3155057 RepID=UPI003450A237
MGTLLITLVLVVALGLTSGAGKKAWPGGTVHGPWRVVFDGEGSVGTDDGTVSLKPRRPVLPSETHAALVVSVDSQGDFDYRLQMRTVEQLRRPDPNSWEVAWVVWHYTDPQHFYYLALKPTGWELGKEDPAYPGAQRFLATGPPAYPIGPWYDVEIRQAGPTMSVVVEDRPLVTFTDKERPYPEGSVGLYSEDAHAEFRHFAH